MGLQFIPNPLYGKLDVSRKTQIASRVELLFDCLASTAVGDIVYQDTVTETLVLTNIDNTVSQPSIGTVISKPSSTTCVVLVLGIQNGYSSLSIGSKIWLGTDGSTTTTKPSTGYLQQLGIAVDSDTIFFLPNSTRILQV